VALDTCLFAVQARRAPREELEARLARLTAWLAPVAVTDARVRFSDGARTLWGAIGVRGEDAPASAASLVWGEAPADGGYAGSGATLEAHGDGVRLVSGSGLPRALYRAESAGAIAWSTHATAAAVLARGAAELDPAAVPAVLAVGAPLGADAHLRGVAACEPGTRVELGPAGARETVALTRAQRWAPVPPADAQRAAEAALLEQMDARLRGEPHVWVALTAGRDSPLVAAALVRLGKPFAAFTWGEEGWGDVARARDTAARLGARHEARGVDWIHDPLTLERMQAEARWSDGLAPVGAWGAPKWPQPLSAAVTGAGAEIARAYYYAWCVRSRARPAPRHLAHVLGLHRRLAGAGDAERAVRARVEAWMAEALELVQHPWDALDVFYTEERMGRWGRPRLPRTRATWIAPFTSAPVASALVSMPLEDRLAMRFHRDLMASVDAGVELPPIAVQRPGGPPALRRAVSAVRGLRAGRAAAEPWLLAGVWDGRERLRAAVEEALAAPWLREITGEPWLAAVRAGLRAERRRESELALAAAGLHAYVRSLDELR